jgi:hypothetical protein
MTKTFEKLGHAITSLGAVIFVMLMVITAMVFFSHTLFTEALPATMSEWEKIGAAWALAFGWEFTVLVTTCNVKHLHPRTPVAMAIASGLILLYFIQAFDTSQSVLIISQRWFVGLLVAAINYIYADLFYRKWLEFIAKQGEPMKLIELQSKVNELQSKVIQAQSERELFNELKQYRARIERELTCPHCKTLQQSYGTLHAHKGYCIHNPKRKNSINAKMDFIAESQGNQ